jgi:hypothetical protein
MSSASTAVLVALLVTCSLCGLLMSLCIWLQARRRQIPLQHQHPPPVPPKDSYTPATSTSLQHSARVCTAANTTKPSNSQQHAWPTAAKRSAAHSLLGMDQIADVLAAIYPARLGSCRQKELSSETLVGRQSPFQIKCKGMGRFSSDLESAWPQPLQPAWTKQDRLPEQQLWRNSSGGSSFYSWPSSWRSVSDTEGAEENVGRWPGAGLGITVGWEQTLARSSRLLPALPTREKPSYVIDTVQANWI